MVGRTTAVAVFAIVVGHGCGASLRKHRQEPYRQTLHNYQNVQYYADFKIGSQEIAGIFDTGSFELLVRSTRCDHCAHPTPAYNHGLSHTYTKNGTITKHVFGSGPCISMMGYEEISVGPLVTKPDQIFWEIVDHRITVLDTAKFAAIVGIGPNFAYDHKEDTLLMSYGIETFSVCLQKPNGSPGYLTWGSTIPDEELQRDYLKADVVGKHHWVTPLQDVTFLSEGADLANTPCHNTQCAVIIDSGTSLIAAPGMALMQLSEQIQPIKEDCSNLHELPTLRFMVGGNLLELPPQAYVMRVTGALMEANDVWDVLFFKPKLRRLDMCMPAFMQMDMMSQHGPVWILGMPFFRYYHTTFDRKNKAMHFGAVGPDCTPLPSVRRNKTESLLTFDSSHFSPMDVEVDAMIPPRLSGMIDFPFNSDGEIEL